MLQSGSFLLFFDAHADTHDASVIVASALVTSRVDYCNSHFMCLSKFNLHNLQRQYSQYMTVSNSRMTVLQTCITKPIDFIILAYNHLVQNKT